MGNLKDEALNTTETEDTQQHELTNSEIGYLRLLNLTLTYHTLGQKIMSGFLYYVCTNRLGYKEGVNLSFNFDFAINEDGSPKSNMLTVTLLPDNATEPAAQHAE